MDAKVREQLMAIRDSGACNMLSLNEVQRAAFNRGFYELVLFIEDHRDDYVHFIFHGDETEEEA